MTTGICFCPTVVHLMFIHVSYFVLSIDSLQSQDKDLKEATHVLLRFGSGSLVTVPCCKAATA